MHTTDNETPSVPPLLRWVVAVAFFMQMLDGTILNTALPAIARDLQVDPLKMQSAIIAYMLTTALLIPASGWLADRFGTRRVFRAAVLLFSLGSLFCALSPSLGYLVLARIVQGLGAALMVPVGRLALIRAYSRQDLVRILSFITIPGLIGPLLGPTTGGILVQYASWHWIFLINLPVGVLGFWLAGRAMPDFVGDDQWKFDLPGFLMFSASMVMITFSMEGLGELSLPRVQVTVLCVGGLLLMGLYWLWAVRTAHPLFEPRIFRNRSFSVGILGNLFSRLGSGAMPFLFPLFLQLSLGFSPIYAGLTMTPTAIAGILGKSVINRLIDRVGFRLFLTVNTVLVGLVMASFAFVNRETPYWMLLVHLGIFGLVNSMQFTAMNSVTLVDLEEDNSSAGNSLLSVTMQVAATCGVSIGAALVSGFSQWHGTGADSMIPDRVFTDTFIIVGALTALTAGIFTQVPADAGADRPGEPGPVHDLAEV